MTAAETTDIDPIDIEIRSALQAAEHILIVSHIRPDGDAVGSLLGLGLALQKAGRTVEMVLDDGVPDAQRELPGSEKVLRQAVAEPDLTVVVDCSDLQRTGNALGGRAPDLVIDHHATNTAFGRINLVEADTAATASVLVRHMPHWGLQIDAEVAACLLTGMLTDTLGFRTSSTTSELLRQAADLIDKGADMTALYFNGLVEQSFAGVRYWGAGLAKLQLTDGIAWTTLTLEDRQAAGYEENDDADLINVLSTIAGARVALLFVEQTPQKTKVSWRGMDRQVNVATLATQFGGGGHKAAAGADIAGALEQVVQDVLATTRRTLSP